MFEDRYPVMPPRGENHDLFPKPAHERVIEHLAAEWQAERQAMVAAAMEAVDRILVFARRSLVQRRRFARYRKFHEGETQ